MIGFGGQNEVMYRGTEASATQKVKEAAQKIVYDKCMKRLCDWELEALCLEMNPEHDEMPQYSAHSCYDMHQAMQAMNSGPKLHKATLLFSFSFLSFHLC